MAEKKKTNSKRRGDFWRSYSFVLTLVVLVSLVVVTSSALSSSAPSSAVPLSNFTLSYNSSAEPYVYSPSGAEGPRAGETYGLSVSGASTVVINPRLNNPTFSRSGSTFVVPSQSISYSYPSDSSYLKYTRYGFSFGMIASTGTSLDWYGNIKITFPADVTNYQLFGNVVVRTVIDSQTFTQTIDVSTDLISSATPIASDGFSFPVHTVINSSITSQSGSVTFSSTIDFSGVRVAMNYDPTILRLTLPSGQYLGAGGNPKNGSSVPPYTYLTQGFLGLREALAGRADTSDITYYTRIWDSSSGQLYRTDSYSVMDLINTIGQWIQQDVAKLRYVLASDDDIETAKQQAPVKDSLKDNFTGESNAAVKPSDVGDMAGFSGSLQESLSTGANASDVFGFIGGSGGVGFWSQAVASDLDNVPVSASDDEEDYVHFYDPSIISDYLSGGDKS